MKRKTYLKLIGTYDGKTWTDRLSYDGKPVVIEVWGSGYYFDPILTAGYKETKLVPCYKNGTSKVKK